MSNQKKKKKNKYPNRKTRLKNIRKIVKTINWAKGTCYWKDKEKIHVTDMSNKSRQTKNSKQTSIIQKNHNKMFPQVAKFRGIQNSVKYLRLSFLQKRLSVVRSTFLQKWLSVVNHFGKNSISDTWVDSGRLPKVNMIFIYKTIGKCLLLPLHTRGCWAAYWGKLFP